MLKIRISGFFFIKKIILFNAEMLKLPHHDGYPKLDHINTHRELALFRKCILEYCLSVEPFAFTLRNPKVYIFSVNSDPSESGRQHEHQNNGKCIPGF
jgi:hypothetical protein